MAPRTVLITGCSQGGLGDFLAQAFHARGLTVFATARKIEKMAHLKALGIHTLTLDVLSSESIAACAAAVAAETGGSLDLLVNNAGHGYTMPLLDVELDTAKRVFDTNVWGVLLMVQAFVPLLLKSEQNPTVINNTSISSSVGMPAGGIYSMSKAATSMLSDVLRLELNPFDIRVVELKTGAVLTSFFDHQAGGLPTLPTNSIYSSVARTEMERVLAGTDIMVPGKAQPVEKWARNVVGDLLRRPSSPPYHIWRGAASFLTRIVVFLPISWTFPLLLRIGAMDIVRTRWRAKKHSE